MTQITRRRLLLGSGAIAASQLVRAGPALASAYPAKPIRWIVTFPAGGGADWITRTMTDRLAAKLGQPVLVDNRPGGASTIGLGLLANSAPDGYTIASAEIGAITMTPHLMSHISYDPVRDFQPVSLMSTNPWLWVVNPEKVPVASFAEFLKLARESPGRFSYASFGPGSITHVMTEMLVQRTGIQMLHVPYKGAAPAHQDLLAGQVDAMITDYGSLKSFESTRRMRALACSTGVRLTQLPELPTLMEEGVPDYDVSSWLGALAPAGTPAPIVERLRLALSEVIASEAVQQELSSRAINAVSSTPDEFADVIRKGLDDWGVVIGRANIKLG